jgi:hypothetical protein
MRASRLPASAGVGFKAEHFREIVEAPQPLGFFEVHAENYMGAGGAPHAQLGALRERYALSIHGVGLSIGSSQPLDREHLARLKTLCDRYEPESFSEHLAWSTHDDVYLTTCCPCPIPKRRLRGSSLISIRCSRRSAGKCCWKIRRLTCSSPRARFPKSSFSRRLPNAAAAGFCST